MTQCGGAAGRAGDLGEDIAAMFTPLAEGELGEIERIGACSGVVIRLEHPHQPVRVGKRQRPEQRSLDDREDGRVGPDAEGQHRDGGRSEARRLGERAEGEFEI